jgi:cellulose synthase/poly-beta-1,6-N-acetylglucosamine synthase-like glycosyltransferase
MLKLSLIIPAYNEEHHIRACLEAVKKQSRMPDEVLVIDNNCTDSTVAIAKEYDFVQIIKEPKQGLIHARNTGFNTASGDVMGRIDADSIIEHDWVDRAINWFKNDDQLYGLTGPASTTFIPYMSYPKTRLFARTYFWFVDAQFNTSIMWGANMAVRKKAWNRVKNVVTMDDRAVHEDQDISVWIAAQGMKILYDRKLLITTDGETYRYLPKLLYYSHLHTRTKNLHRQNGNLFSTKLHTIGHFRTIPGRMMSILLGTALVLTSVMLFPVDYIVMHKR